MAQLVCQIRIPMATCRVLAKPDKQRRQYPFRKFRGVQGHAVPWKFYPHLILIIYCNDLISTLQEKKKEEAAVSSTSACMAIYGHDGIISSGPVL